MNVYYAMGGGLGHLTRARAFLFSLGLNGSSTIITSSAFAQDARVTGDIPICTVDQKFEKDRAGFGDFLRAAFERLEAKTVYLDSFPVGITGELANFDFGEIKVNYVARILKWENYLRFASCSDLRYTNTFVLEPVAQLHSEFIDRHTEFRREINLQYSRSGFSPSDSETVRAIEQSPFWLIVHSGSKSEVLDLVNYALEMREIENEKVKIVLISPRRIAVGEISQYDLYPASALFKTAKRIFTGCGFNVMKEASSFADKHYFIPFERRYDDQYRRAAMALKRSE